VNIVFPIFDQMTQLDFAGPAQVLSRLPGAEIHVAASKIAPVMTDCGFAIMPTVDFQSCPKADLVCVPGGLGVASAIKDGAILYFVRRQNEQAKYITSVCTGAFILGMAGPLDGRRATTHWAYTDMLEQVGFVHENARVVMDGNLITGGGVTAGIDFALAVVAEVAGKDVAKTIQLSIEYDPQPPFESGSPTNAPAQITDYISGLMKDARKRMLRVCDPANRLR